MRGQNGIGDMQAPTAAEQGVLHAARVGQDRCACGEAHDDGAEVARAVIARMKAYTAVYPDRQFAVDDETGIVAVVIPHPPGAPEVIARSPDLADLLNRIGAPAAEELS